MRLALLIPWLALAAPAYADDTYDDDVLGMPAPVHRPERQPPPSQEQAHAFFEQLRAKVRRGADPTWTAAHVRSDQLAAPPSEAWVDAMDHALTERGALGQRLLETSGPIATRQGPDYTRLVLDGSPTLSLVLRADAEGLVVDGFEVTSCTLCDERSRFVRDLLADVALNGRDAHRLLPGVELDVTPYLQDNPGLVGSKWVGTLQTRNHEGGELVRLLTGAEVVDAEGDVVMVRLSDGTVDTWAVRYVHGGP